jgi:hypothetical protein
MNNTQETPIIEANETPKPKKTKTTNFLPSSQFDLLTLAESAVNKWLENPQLTLMWVKADNFKQTVSEFRTFLAQRVEAGSGRGSQTQTLNNLDKEINKACLEVKTAILAKFGTTQGKAYFGEFGIVKQNGSLRLPTDRNQRLNALPLFIKAVKAHNLQVVGFDSRFFDSLLDAYAEAFKATRETDSAISTSVGNKNDLRKQVETVLSALNTLIKVNYPNTYEGELRGWGFQKEKY